jgi:hypothetical protein
MRAIGIHVAECFKRMKKKLFFLKHFVLFPSDLKFHKIAKNSFLKLNCQSDLIKAHSNKTFGDAAKFISDQKL